MSYESKNSTYIDIIISICIVSAEVRKRRINFLLYLHTFDYSSNDTIEQESTRQWCRLTAETNITHRLHFNSSNLVCSLRLTR